MKTNLERGRDNMGNKYTCGAMIFDFIMTILTGGGWLIWVLIKYLRLHS